MKWKKNTKLGIIHQRKTTNAFISQGSQGPAPDRLKDRWVSWVMGAEWQGMLWLNPILGCCSEFVLGKSMEELYTVHELDELVTLDELDELLGKRSEKS